jgi:hypothetical protein
MTQAPASPGPGTEAAIGRGRELAALCRVLDEDGPAVTFVDGIGGIGKTTLIRAFAAEAKSRGASVAVIDARTVEPTEQGFLRELRTALRFDGETLADVARELAERPGTVVVVVDTYELLRLLDTWMRQAFVHLLPSNARLVLASRDIPVHGWHSLSAGVRRFQHLTLDVLEREDALALLKALGVPGPRGEALYRVTLGHPLAIALAAAAAERRSWRYSPDEAAIAPIIEDLARMYMEEVPDREARETLLAASVVRRATVSLIEAMLPGYPADRLFEQLRSLPFTEMARDGLLIHDSVQHALSALLEATDPAAYARFRRAAATQLLKELRESGNAEAWRYTADLLYLLQQPIIRGAFFPRDAHQFAIEPARANDGPAIATIATDREGPEAAAALVHWWSVAPWAFSVARDEDGGVAGFSILLEPGRLPHEALVADPLTAAWIAHLTANPMQPHERAIMCRRWMSRDEGEGFGSVQAAIWLDLKRTYLEMRPNLRRMYGVVKDIAGYAPTLTALGFEPLADCHRTLDGETHHMAALDFGPRSTDGWLQDHLCRELGLPAAPALTLDTATRELVIDGSSVALTKLEYGVMEMLWEADGAVSRIDLLARVWGYDYDGGSNVVDVVVAALRRKLGERAGAIQTVRGLGYRLRRE